MVTPRCLEFLATSVYSCTRIVAPLSSTSRFIVSPPWARFMVELETN